MRVAVCLVDPPSNCLDNILSIRLSTVTSHLISWEYLREKHIKKCVSLLIPLLFSCSRCLFASAYRILAFTSFDPTLASFYPLAVFRSVIFRSAHLPFVPTWRSSRLCSSLKSSETSVSQVPLAAARAVTQTQRSLGSWQAPSHFTNHLTRPTCWRGLPMGTGGAPCGTDARRMGAWNHVLTGTSTKTIAVSISTTTAGAAGALVQCHSRTRR